MKVKKKKASKVKKHVDPLHVPSEKLVVYHKGKEAVLLNKALLDQQNCWDKVETIKLLHVERLAIEDAMDNISKEDELNHLLKGWTGVQFLLQDAWGFPRDARYHRFWDIPACNCPKLDNDDAYPSGYYVRSGNCKLHGRDIRRVL